MILYVIGSIGFFLFLLRQLFQWVFLWQKADYSLREIFILNVHELRKRKEHSIFLFLFFCSCVFYTFVIFNDFLSTIFQIYITGLFVMGGLLFIQDVKNDRLIKPLFTTFSIAVITITLFVMSLFFMLPLLDRFAWFLVLISLMPIFVTAIISVFSFPREIFTDLFMQKARMKLLSQKTKTILIIGQKDKDIVEKSMKTVLSLEKKSFSISETSSVIQLCRKIIHANVKDFLFLHYIPSSKSQVKKLVTLCQPYLVLYISTPMASFSEKKEFFTIQHYFLNQLSKDTIVLLNAEDLILVQLTQMMHHPTILYGNKENLHSEDLFLLLNVIKRRKDIIQFEAIIGKRKILYKTHLRMKNISTLLPAIFMANVWGLNKKEIEKKLYILGISRKYHLAKNW